MIKFGPESTYDDEMDFEKSKSQVKKELLALKALGKQLLELPIKDLEKLALPESIFEALVKAKSMTHGALKRQIGFIGGLLTNEDGDLIEQKLDKLRQAHNGEKKLFHQMEQWRDQLLAGDKAVMTELRQQFPEIDMQYLRQLVRNANKEQAQDKTPKSARLLFKYLQQLQQDLINSVNE